MRWHRSNPIRFELEKRLLAQCHPGVKMIIKNGRVKILKRIKTRKNTYHVEARCPKDFPYSPIKVFVREPRLKESSPHRYSESQLCLHGPGDVGPETTAKVYLDWAVQWIRIYERWLDGKPWPETNKGLTI